MDVENPLVSIVTPTYNRAAFLPLTIESVLNQTYDNFEMHIVDDGSSDNTHEIIQNYLSDRRINYHQREHMGQSGARNYGLQKSRGEFICFLDSDDLFNPEKLSLQVALMQTQPEVDVLYGDYEHIDETGEVINRDNMPRFSGNIYKNLLLQNCISMNSTMARRKCFDELGGFDESIKFSDDYDLWLRFSTVYRFHYEPSYYTRYRIMENTLSAQKWNRFKSVENIIANSIQKNYQLLSNRERNFIWHTFYARRAYYLTVEGKFSEAIDDNLRAIKHRFYGRMPWKGLIKTTVRKYLL